MGLSLVSEHFAHLRGEDRPRDPSRDGSRGYVEAMDARGVDSSGLENGTIQDGFSSVYAWRETTHRLEIVMLIRPGLRKSHLSWDLSPRALVLNVQGRPVSQAQGPLLPRGQKGLRS